jgi:hypothetical protein
MFNRIGGGYSATETMTEKENFSIFILFSNFVKEGLEVNEVIIEVVDI